MAPSLGRELDLGDAAPTAAAGAAVAAEAPEHAATLEARPAGGTAAGRRKMREGTKQVALIAVLRYPEGASIAQIVEATGCKPHTVRGALAGVLKNRLGLTVTSEKVEA